MLLAALVLLSGCGGRKDDSLRIGTALYTQDDTFISTVAQNLEWMVREAESGTGNKITLFTADGKSSQSTQMDQVDRFLARGCDVLFVNLVDRTAAAVIADKAEAEGVPLIFFNRQPVAEDIQRWERIYYVGADARESGELQGKLVLDAWRADRETLDRSGDGILQYVMLEGEPGHQDSLLRTEYAVKAVTDGGVEVEKLANETANWNRAQAAARTAQWLEEFGEGIEVIFANNDDMALGAIDALADTPRDRWPLIVGVDATAPALEAVAAGQLYGTVHNDGRGQAQAMMDLALALWEGEEPAVELVEGHYIWLPYRAVTRENLEEFLEQ
ncbi:galactose ABC transporter substrate-binding protein [uncultured Oscillibacter sp.]|uniref:galactose ABC transporter substrate-binding protein n=1 Tax=uncultured Oscillibacter sp. TaxID=876091 RepID=UPI0025F25B87|nr:galactose ABC transporter substrate-binding protein [uncultured Oscillibacter sp.]